MVIYEVNLLIQRDAAEDFGAWLDEHIQEMLTLDGFESATRLECLDETPSDEDVAWTVQYQVHDKAALERYFKDDAARMRKEGVQRFGGRFSATRRILKSGKRFRATNDNS